MFWHDIDLNDVVINEKKITYHGKPLRFQIPRGHSEYGLSERGSITVTIQNDEFFEWFKKFEEHLNLPENFESNVTENTIRVKFSEGFTQVFDSNNVYIMDGHTFVNTDVDILLDVSSVYSPFKDFNKYGLVCKIYQVRVLNSGCLFV